MSSNQLSRHTLNTWAQRFPWEDIYPNGNRTAFNELDTKRINEKFDILAEYCRADKIRQGMSADSVWDTVVKLDALVTDMYQIVKGVAHRRITIQAGELGILMDTWLQRFIEWRFKNYLTIDSNNPSLGFMVHRAIRLVNIDPGSRNGFYNVLLKVSSDRRLPHYKSHFIEAANFLAHVNMIILPLMNSYKEGRAFARDAMRRGRKDATNGSN